MFMKVKSYKLPNYWEISFPSTWKYEVDTSDIRQDIFYPQDSDLTVRITIFEIRDKKNNLLSLENLDKVFMHTIDSSFLDVNIQEYSLNEYTSKAFISTTIENNKLIYMIRIGYYGNGSLLTMNIFSSSKEECYQALKFLKTLKRI